MREIVCPAGPSDRLDRVLPRLVEGLSRSQARRLIAAGCVFLDGRRCQVASRTVHAGSSLRVEDAPTPVPAKLVVLYEDAACIAVDKPAGMAAAPTRRASAGTALEELRRQHPSRGPAGLWLVHRLDRDTSGVLLFALTRDAAGALDAAFRERRVAKEYLAWVAGRVEGETGRIDAALREDGLRSVVDPGGKTAETHWQVVGREDDRTLLCIRPTTGRMHQIRVHLQSIGHPVLGDRVYGGPRAPRLMLHAHSLTFTHPSSGSLVRVVSPPAW